MNTRRGRVTIIVFVMASFIWQGIAARAQRAEPAKVESHEKDRRRILESDRWRRAHRDFNEWLSVQQIYTANQIAAVKAELTARIAEMSPRELEDFLKDMEARLAVLKSPDAEDARVWLAQFFATARNPEALLGRSRPDVMNMTASQIRQELLWLEQHRAGRQQRQAAFEQGRASQVQSAIDVQASRQRAAEQSRIRGVQPPRIPASRSQYAPNREFHQAPPPRRPAYMIGPGGTLVQWRPL